MGPLALFLVVAAVGGLFVWLGILAERRRLAAFTEWAAARGWEFDPAKVRNPGYDYELFERGHTRFLRYAAEKVCPAPTPGLGDVRLRLFEYHYAVTRSSGKHTHTENYYSTCAIADPRLDLGRVQLRREGLGDKLLQAVGFDDIDLEDPEFSKRYVVKARDRKDAYDLLDGPMMRFLTLRGAPDVETRGRELFLHVGRKPTPRDYTALADFALGFLAQLPRPLVNAERARRGLPPLVEAGNASPSSQQELGRMEGEKS